MSHIVLATSQLLELQALTMQFLHKRHLVAQIKLESADSLVAASSKSELVILSHPDFSVLKASLEYLHEMSFRSKVLVITHHATLEERLQLWHLGADDQLCQPIHVPECLLRCQRLLHYHKILKTEALNSTNLTFQPQTGLLIKDEGDHSIRSRLRRREADIFCCLLRHKNQVVSRDMLIKWVWSGQPEIPTYSTIDVYLRRIRMALHDRNGMLKTIRGFGYMLCD